MEVTCIQNEMVCLQYEWRAASGSRNTSVFAVKKVDRDLRTIRQVPVSRSMHMSTRALAFATNDDTLRTPPPSARRAAPQAGDILVSKRRARADVFTVSIVPTGSDVSVTRYAAAIERVQALARTRRVDGWYTCDHTHYVRVASYRS